MLLLLCLSFMELIAFLMNPFLPVICPSVIILTPILPLQLPHPQEKEKKKLSRRKAWERKGKAQKEEVEKKGGEQEKEEHCMQQGKGGKEEEDEGKSKHMHSKDIVFRS